MVYSKKLAVGRGGTPQTAMSKGLSNLERLRILEEHLASAPSKYTIEKKSPPSLAFCIPACSPGNTYSLAVPRARQ